MAVSTTLTRIKYNCDGVITTYAYPFKILQDAELLAIKADANGIETTLVLNTDYTVTDAGDETGGNLVLVSGDKCPDGYTLTLLRNIPLTQATEYVDGEGFSSKSVENALDKMVLIQQQQQEEIDRAVKLKRSSSSTNLVFPSPVPSAYIGWDSTGTVLENKGDAAGTGGNVLGPASSTPGNVAIFDGTDGRVIIDGGISLSDLATHAPRHKSGGADEIKIDELAAPTDTTTLDVSTSAHGLVPKAPNDTTQFLRGDATWAVIPERPSVRNTVQSGANTIGTGSALQPSLAGATTPVRVTFAAGFNAGGALDYAGVIDSNTSWPSVVAGNTNFLYIDRNTGTGALTLGSSIVLPIYGPHDISGDTFIFASTGGGTPIESGHAGSQTASLAFDNNNSTYWKAQTTGTGTWVGYNFSTPITPASFTMLQNVPEQGISVATSVTFQYSDNGTDWSSQGTYTVAANANTVTVTGAAGPHKYWRFLCAAGPSQYWEVFEIQIIPTVSVDQYWYDTVNHVSKVWNGSAWDTVQRVMVGEAVAGAASVSSVVQYALNGKYDSYDQTTTATSTTLNHNLGMSGVKVTLLEGAFVSRTQIMSKDFTLTRNSVTWSAVAGTSRVIVERPF